MGLVRLASAFGDGRSVSRLSASVGRAFRTSSVAVVSARKRSSFTDVPRGSRAQRTTVGSSRPCTTRVVTMTPEAAKTILSRSGKGAPESSAVGTDRGTASETAPREPVIDVTARAR